MSVARTAFIFALCIVFGQGGGASHDCFYTDDSAERSAVQCQVDTLQDSEAGNDAGSVPLDASVRSFTVVCNDGGQGLHSTTVSRQESQMTMGQFKLLAGLQSLAVVDCHIRSVPKLAFAGLHQLRHLSIRTNDLPSASDVHEQQQQQPRRRPSLMNMELAGESFANLDRLESLALVGNGIWSLPAELLCATPSLQQLDLSGNNFVELTDLGLSGSGGAGRHGVSSCQADLTQLANLNVSHNQIGHLESLGVELGKSVAKSLQSIDLSFNGLNTVGSDAFDDCASLIRVNLAHNSLSSLPESVFNFSTQLETLELQNNSLERLPAHVFASLTSLTSLNLSGNAFVSDSMLDSTFFKSLTSLTVLDLSYNQISLITIDALAPMVSLRLLDLSHNQVHTVEPSAFAALVHLHVLDLAHNRLTSIVNHTFVGLQSLRSLALDHNQLVTAEIEHGVSANLSALSLNNNHLAKVPSFIGAACPNLTQLDLGSNLIATIAPSDLASMAKLFALGLSNNHLDRLDNTTFKSLAAINHDRLEVLDLSNNRLTEIEVGTFDVLANLHSLRLQSNLLTDLNGLIYDLPHLDWVNVSANAIGWFDYAFLPSGLRTLDISRNRINELANFYNLTKFGLQILVADYNLITTVGPQSFTPNLQLIGLAHNSISHVDDFAFANLTDLVRVDLAYNYIQSVSESAFAFFPSSTFTSGGQQRMDWVDNERDRLAASPRIVLANNPLTCDCHMKWLKSEAVAQSAVQQQPSYFYYYGTGLISGKSGPKSIMTIDEVESLNCLVPAQNELSRIAEVAESDFLCPYATHCASSCMCCDFYACDCRFQCPDGCACFHDANWTQNVVSCAAQNLAQVPILIPLDATTLRLDGNAFGHVETQSFLGRDNIVELYMNASHVISIGNNSFAGLHVSLRSLHLEANRISTLNGFEFSSLGQLRELFLHNNVIEHIDVHTFADLSSLNTLTLHGNRISTFPIWAGLSLSRHPFLSELHLSANLWSCSCSFIRNFNAYLDRSRSVVVDYDAVQCVADSQLIVPTEHDGSDIFCSEDIIAGDEDVMMSGGQVDKFGNTFGLSSSGPLDMNAMIPLVRQHSNDRIDRGMQHGGGGVVGHNNVTSVVIAMVLACIMCSTALLALFVYKRQIRDWLYAAADVRAGKGGSTSGGMNNNNGISNELGPSGPSVYSIGAAYSAGYMDSKSGTVAPSAHHHRPQLSIISTASSCNGQAKLFDVFASYAEADADFVERAVMPNMSLSAQQSTAHLHQHQPTSSAASSCDYKMCLQQRDCCPGSLQSSESLSVAVESSTKCLVVASDSYFESVWPVVRHVLMTSPSQQLDGHPTAYAIQSYVVVLCRTVDDITRVASDDLLRHCPVVRWGEPGWLTKLRFYLPEPAHLTFQRNVTMRHQASGTSLAPNGGYYAANLKTMQVQHHRQKSSSASTSSSSSSRFVPVRPSVAPSSSTTSLASSSGQSSHIYQSVVASPAMAALTTADSELQARHIYHTAGPGVLAPYIESPSKQSTKSTSSSRLSSSSAASSSSTNGGGLLSSWLNSRMGRASNERAGIRTAVGGPAGSSLLPAALFKHSHSHSASSGQHLLTAEGGHRNMAASSSPTDEFVERGSRRTGEYIV